MAFGGDTGDGVAFLDPAALGFDAVVVGKNWGGGWQDWRRILPYRQANADADCQRYYSGRDQNSKFWFGVLGERKFRGRYGSVFH